LRMLQNQKNLTQKSYSSGGIIIKTLKRIETKLKRKKEETNRYHLCRQIIIIFPSLEDYYSFSKPRFCYLLRLFKFKSNVSLLLDTHLINPTV